MEAYELESLKAARRRRVAEEISDALKKTGMSRKEFAIAMNRQPSEVTKWLSGNHNFTCDLLEEISQALGAVISGTRAQTLSRPGSLVDGYTTGQSLKGEVLCEPSWCELLVDLPSEAAEKLSRRAALGAMTLREYARKVLCEKSEEKTLGIMDLCGSCPDFPTTDELRSFRTSNTIPEL